MGRAGLWATRRQQAAAAVAAGASAPAFPKNAAPRLIGFCCIKVDAFCAVGRGEANGTRRASGGRTLAGSRGATCRRGGTRTFAIDS